ncbi:ATP-binding cassette domain-containing protein [Kitasatospora sp. LaBMicrA B282]|uniref:ATP-binding cassette domain-containing protein n=1 Tax=Kitasatospora sp. LaBMicrA B282 TaxID=3420949 RepID=UPI003D123470
MTAPSVTTLRPTAISALGLTKSYGDRQVLAGINLNIPEGTVFALLGPNSAGKTTAVQILSTLIPADAGAAQVAGHDLARNPDGVRAAIGVTGQFSAVDNLLTAEENLLLMADLHHLDRREGRRRAADLLRRFDLTEVARKPAVTFSGGMRRKLDLAMTLVGEPRVIFLDEPTTGLDPRSRRTMWGIIRNLVAEHRVTVFLTTQYLDEADQLADRIAVLDHGRLIAEGTAEELKRRIPGGHLRLRFAGTEQLTAAERLFARTGRDDEALTLTIPGDGGLPALRAVLDTLDRAGVPAEELTVHTPDLDDVFLTLTGDGVPHSKEPAR